MRDTAGPASRSSEADRTYATDLPSNLQQTCIPKEKGSRCRVPRCLGSIGQEACRVHPSVVAHQLEN